MHLALALLATWELDWVCSYHFSHGALMVDLCSHLGLVPQPAQEAFDGSGCC